MKAVPPAEIPDRTQEGDQTPTGRGRALSEQSSGRSESLSPIKRPETPETPAEGQGQPKLELPNELERDRLEDPFQDDPLTPPSAAAMESAVSHSQGRLVKYTPPDVGPQASGEILPAALTRTLHARPSTSRAEKIDERVDIPLLSVPPIGPMAPIRPYKTDSGNPLRYLARGVDRPVAAVPVPSTELIRPHGPSGTKGENESPNPLRR